MMKATAEVIQFKNQKQSEFVCSACGADRYCDCNAPALERIAELKERERKKKQRQREAKKASKINSDVPGTAEPSNIEESKATYAAMLEEPCDDCEGNEERWQNSIKGNAAHSASLLAYWNKHFPGWERFEITSDIVPLVLEAAKVWQELATSICQGKGEKWQR